MSIKAEVVCHSEAPNGEQLLTLELEFHRFILAEINTHRVLSRNYQSSRAVPVEKMIKQVTENPAIPVHWGKNQRGMVAEESCSRDIDLCNYYGGEWENSVGPEECWKIAARQAAMLAEEFSESGYHKQIVNRLLEPFIWTKGVITATLDGWNSVLELRLHKDAQPEFRALAVLIKGAIDNSKPTKLDYGDWHLPYVEWSRDSEGQYFVDDNITTIEEAIKVSCSSCGQISYRALDTSLEKAIKIYDMLNLPEGGVFKDDPPHFSPAEHVAVVVDDVHHEEIYTGNFVSSTFEQYRKLLEYGIEGAYI